MIRLYDSPAQLAAECTTHRSMASGSRYAERDAWCGDARDLCLSRARIGDLSLVPEAEKLLSALDTEIEVPRRTWERSPAGSFCAVPDYLAGLPTPMRRQREVGD